MLGILAVTSEYTTGMIGATFSAVPQRRTVLAAKTAVFSVTALIVGVVSCLGAYFAFEAVLTDDSMSSSIGDPGVLRAVVGAAATSR